MSITKNVPLNWYSSMKKKLREIRIRKLTLKVRNWQFSITSFRAGVDLPENLFYEEVLFFTPLSYPLMCMLLKKFYMLSTHEALERIFLLHCELACRTFVVKVTKYQKLFWFRFLSHVPVNLMASSLMAGGRGRPGEGSKWGFRVHATSIWNIQ